MRRPEQAEVAALPHGYQDEMEARTTTARAAWLASGHLAAIGPDRLLTRSHHASGCEGDSS